MVKFSILRKAYERWKIWYPPLQGMPNPYSVFSFRERKDYGETITKWWRDCIKETLEEENKNVKFR